MIYLFRERAKYCSKDPQQLPSKELILWTRLIRFDPCKNHILLAPCSNGIEDTREIRTSLCRTQPARPGRTVTRGDLATHLDTATPVAVDQLKPRSAAQGSGAPCAQAD